MAKLLIINLVFHTIIVTHALHVRQGLVTDGISKHTANADTALVAPEQAGALFSMAGCLMRMPYLQYMSYSAASFCRVYLYSCNNLWPEELNSEIREGTFCLINSYEQGGQSKAGYEQFHAYTSTVIEPFFDMLNEAFEYTNKKTMIEGNNLSAGMEMRQLQDVPCEHVSDKLPCMIQTMKRKLSQAGTFELEPSKLSPNQTLRLFGKVENVTKGLALFEEANRVLATGPGKKDYSRPVKGPLTSALGTENYGLSSFPHHIGPVSPNLRYPHDAVQPGLLMQKIDLSTVDSRAVCNDGSPAIMYIKEHPTEKAKWHFHVDGGFFCFNQETCRHRAHESPGLISTKGFENEKHNSGMFDPVMGGFPDYTHGSAVYCSSDAWMGQIEVEDFQLVEGTTLSNGQPGTYFHGYFILEAVLKKYISMGMGSTPGQELWVSGCSAGSIAATAMADSWGPRLQALGILHPVTHWNMLDNAPIISPPGVNGYPSIFKMAMGLVNFLYGPTRNVSAGVFMNQNCAADNPANPGACVFPGTGILYIKSPNIVLNQLWDNFVMAKTYGFMHPVTSYHYSTGMVVVKGTKEIFKKVSPTQNYWAISCGDHCMSANPNFWRLVPNTAHEKLSARDMVLQTREGALGKSGMLGRVVCDECDHYNCGCVGQSTSMTKLALNSVFFKVMEKLAPGMNPMKKVPATIFVTTAIAADMASMRP